MSVDNLVLYWNENLSDHVVTVQNPGEGYSEVGVVGKVMKSACGLGNGIMLKNEKNMQKCKKNREVASIVDVPRNWELDFDVVPSKVLNEEGFLMSWVASGKSVFSVSIDKGSQRILIRTATALLKSTKLLPVETPTNITIRMVNTNLKLYLNKEEDCWMQEGRYLSNITVSIFSCRDTDTPANACISDITLFPAKTFSIWETQKNYRSSR
eukprot:TRINITY_DN10656_c1_g4_i3.p1 TRINITY_DN10656_c1_g4~~TRINITY_DN10656_c1_g4_i3.p1  ORF type:complete len:225 (+),score=32.66 TRINITY_DN10656_c1_g4_i3:44-676(+)